jgi:aquaporin Z
MTTPSLGKRSLAEFIGTFWLVFAGIGSAMLSAGVAKVGIGWLGVAFAVGLTVLTMAYAIGHISGCHLNPAVSLGLCIGRRFPAKDLPAYIIAQVLGGIVAGALLWVIIAGRPTPVSDPSFVVSQAFEGASNGYAEHSPQGYSMAAGLLAEIVLTFMFLVIIMGATDRRAPQGFAPLAIGLGLTLIHLVGIPITNLSVNPARSTGIAIFAGGWAVAQLWLFWVAPIIGGLLGGFLYSRLAEEIVESPVSPLDRLSQQSEARAAAADKTIR